jgi:hypothetical protein
MENNKEHSRYVVGDWAHDELKTWTATVYVGGDLAVTELVCRRLCFPKGMCVTLKPTTYIFAGGIEQGVEVGLIQYPPFPEAEEALLDKAIWVGREVAEANFQWSYSVVTLDKTHFFSRRKR